MSIMSVLSLLILLIRTLSKKQVWSTRVGLTPRVKCNNQDIISLYCILCIRRATPDWQLHKSLLRVIFESAHQALWWHFQSRMSVRDLLHWAPCPPSPTTLSTLADAVRTFKSWSGYLIIWGRPWSFAYKLSAVFTQSLGQMGTPHWVQCLTTRTIRDW